MFLGFVPQVTHKLLRGKNQVWFLFMLQVSLSSSPHSLLAFALVLGTQVLSEALMREWKLGESGFL